MAGIIDTLSPIVNVVRFVQPLNIEDPISVHFSALNVTEVRPEQSEKAQSPMEVTELGMVTEVSPEQSMKAQPPIEVTELGMIVLLQPATNLFVDDSIIALQLSRESYVPLFLSTVTEVSPVQPSKANEPIEVTEYVVLLYVIVSGMIILPL